MERSHNGLKEVRNREIERDHLLDDLRKKIIDKEDQLGKKSMMAALLIKAVYYLLPAGEVHLENRFSGPHNFGREFAFLEAEVFPDINRFTSIDEERWVLITRLLEFATESFGHEFHSTLSQYTTLRRNQFLDALEQQKK